MATNEELKKEATTWLIAAGVTSVTCFGCCMSLIGAVLCFLALQAAEQGNTADAEAKLRWGKIVTLGGVVFGLLVFTAALLVRYLGS